MDADYIEGMPLPTGAAHSVSNQGEGGPDPESEVMEKINDIERELNRLQKRSDIDQDDFIDIETVLELLSEIKKRIKVVYLHSKPKSNPVGFR